MTPKIFLLKISGDLNNKLLMYLGPQKQMKKSAKYLQNKTSSEIIIQDNVFQTFLKHDSLAKSIIKTKRGLTKWLIPFSFCLDFFGGHMPKQSKRNCKKRTETTAHKSISSKNSIFIIGSSHNENNNAHNSCCNS